MIVPNRDKEREYIMNKLKKEERDDIGRFVKGHKLLSSPQAMIEYNKKHGVWNKDKKGLMPKQTISIREQKSKKMQENYKNPTWNEKDRRKKISEKLKGHKVSKETKEKFKKQARKSKKQGTNFEYRAKAYMEKQNEVIQVLRAGGSRDIDLTVIWKKSGSWFITKEEVKSSLSWFKTISKNPLTLLDKEDKFKLVKSFNLGFSIFLIYRIPKEKSGEGYMSKQTEILRIELDVKDNEIIQK